MSKRIDLILAFAKEKYANIFEREAILAVLLNQQEVRADLFRELSDYEKGKMEESRK